MPLDHDIRLAEQAVIAAAREWYGLHTDSVADEFKLMRALDHLDDLLARREAEREGPPRPCICCGVPFQMECYVCGGKGFEW
jgi:hypothetical protein